jgi:hypothetical protein
MSGEKTISEWLDRHELTHLREAFETNGIELDILQDLTSDDLAQIGITLGDRKRVLKAVASEFGTASPAQLIEADVAVGQASSL